MRLDKAMLVFKKDFIEISRNKEILLPMLVLPLIFALFLPALSVIAPENINTGGDTDAMIEAMLSNLPPDIQESLSNLSPTQLGIYVMVVYMFAPFFLIIPLMSSSVISSDSFAGEKERNTLEALLTTPLTDSELLLGKILVSFIPSMGVTILGFLLYTVTVDVLTKPIFGFYIMPTFSWLVMIFILSPAISFLGIGGTVIISSRVKGFREAQQLSALLVVPILSLFFGQATGFLILGPTIIIGLALAILVIDYVVFRFALRLFQRDKILSQSR